MYMDELMETWKSDAAKIVNDHVRAATEGPIVELNDKLDRIDDLLEDVITFLRYEVPPCHEAEAACLEDARKILSEIDAEDVIKGIDVNSIDLN